MAHDFPNSPSVGDTTTANGITYRWDGSSWNVITESVRNVVDTMSGSTIDYNAGTYHVLDLDSGTTSVTLTVSNLPSTSEKHTLQVNFTSAATYSITWPSEFEFNTNVAPTLPISGTGSLILELYNSDNTTIYATEKFNNS